MPERSYCLEQVPLPDGGFSPEGTAAIQRCVSINSGGPNPCPRPTRLSDSIGCCVTTFVGDETMPGYYRYRACALLSNSDWNRAVCERGGGTWGL